MNRLMSFTMAAALVVGGVSLMGCQSDNSNPPRSQSNNGYEGGNGVYGENPANPGERSGQRFENATGANPTTQPSSGSYQNH